VDDADGVENACCAHVDKVRSALKAAKRRHACGMRCELGSVV
jgi:hypothetical protein